MSKGIFGVSSSIVMRWGRRGAIALFLGILLLAAEPAQAVNFFVTSTLDDGSTGTLRWAILQSNAAGGTNTITFTTSGTITLTGDLPAVQSNVTILGNNATLSGNNQFRGLFIGAFSGSTQVAVTVSIQDLTIANAKAQGGNGGTNFGGGGGGCLGGAIFVADHADVTISNVTLQNDAANGGNGASGLNGGGGGGMGGNGGVVNGNADGGGGGLGRGADGGNGTGSGLPGIAIGASSGGAGNSGGSGGLAGGGGGGAGGGQDGGGGGGVGGSVA
jgi:hypothetical protein